MEKKFLKQIDFICKWSVWYTMKTTETHSSQILSSSLKLRLNLADHIINVSVVSAKKFTFLQHQISFTFLECPSFFGFIIFCFCDSVHLEIYHFDTMLSCFLFRVRLRPLQSGISRRESPAS